MNLKKLLMKLTGKQTKPEVNRVKVDINYVQSYVDSNKVFVSNIPKENSNNDTKQM